MNPIKNLFMLFVMGATAFAGDILLNPRAQVDFGAAAEIEVTQDGLLAPTGSGLVRSVQHTLVDTKKRYRVSVEYKKSDAVAESRVRGTVVLSPYNMKCKMIEGVHVSFIEGSEAEVLEISPSRGKRVVLRLTDAWKKELESERKVRRAVTFLVKRDLSDIPNFYWSVIDGYEIDGDRLILKVNWTPALVPGDLVRLHYYGWQGIGKDVYATDEWQTLSFEVTGESKRACSDKFWAGTQAVGLGIGGKGVLFRNLTFEELD